MLSKKLAELRKERGLSQMELAERLDVTRQAVSRWETGDAAPSLENLISLGELYGVTLDDLVRDEKPVPAPPDPASPEAAPPDQVPPEAAPAKPARAKYKIWALVLAAVLVLAVPALVIGAAALLFLAPPKTSLARPTEPGPEQAVPSAPYTADQEQADPPFAATADLLHAFAEEKRDFQDAARHSLTARGLEDGAYAVSEETYALPAGYTRLALQCTWSGYTDVTVGLRDTGTGRVYTLRLTGRSAAGSLSLRALPPGEYEVVLYGGDRFESDPLAVMWYQLQAGD